jgi:hypothetical protein
MAGNKTSLEGSLIDLKNFFKKLLKDKLSTKVADMVDMVDVIIL